MPDSSEQVEQRAVKVLMSELRDGSEKIANSLYPKGPPGSRTLAREQELDMVARHWEDPKFRKNLLDRMAPPGPDGNPDPVLAENFIKLYREAVLDRGSVAQDVVDKQAERPPQPGVPTPTATPLGTGETITVGTGGDTLTPASYRGGRETPEPTTPNVMAPPSADPTGAPAATPEAVLPQLPAGMAPPPPFPEGL